MRGNRLVVIACSAAACMAAGCQEGADDGFRVDATGAVVALAWLDRNGNGVLEGSDGPAPDVRIELRAGAAGAALYGASSNDAGEVLFPEVMVGDYRTVVDSASVGDTLRIFRVDPESLTVMAGDTSIVLVGVTYPTLTTDSVRVAPRDRRVFIHGRVISEWDTFGDAAVHVRDTTGALRAVRTTASSVVLGDSIRLVGVTSSQSGEAVLKDGMVFLLETRIETPDPVSTTTAEARTADDGRLDAELVRVTNAVIQDTTRNAFGEPVLQVDDGSGMAEIVLDRDIPFLLSVPGGGDLIGAIVDATGVLVPPASGAAGIWVLKPRQNSDLTLRAP